MNHGTLRIWMRSAAAAERSGAAAESAKDAEFGRLRREVAELKLELAADGPSRSVALIRRESPDQRRSGSAGDLAAGPFRRPSVTVVRQDHQFSGGAAAAVVILIAVGPGCFARTQLVSLSATAWCRRRRLWGSGSAG